MFSFTLRFGKLHQYPFPLDPCKAVKKTLMKANSLKISKPMKYYALIYKINIPVQTSFMTEYFI